MNTSRQFDEWSLRPRRTGLLGTRSRATMTLAILISLVLPFTTTQTKAQVGDLADLQRRFQNPPDDSRIMMRWWWFGPSVTRTELEREMKLMKEGGIGGFEVQPV